MRSFPKATPIGCGEQAATHFFFLNKFYLFIFNIFIFFLLRWTHVAILLALTWRLTESVKFFNGI
jgi:hypothetical protein